MSEHIENADGQGEILIDGNRAPVPYLVKVVRENSSYEVQVSLNASRDWLLTQGFEREATLLRGNGDSISVRADKVLQVGDPLSVVLHAEPETIGSREDLLAAFPELDVARMHRL
ncbi:hypothetical protein HFC70_20655 [Agrobacterium sp. a22-2]|uniref:hypothetical protein n=1 Tax=Agrobacterium sp. a22-2 TaxID=2283840 RepID=UPI0014465A17|nr:hypothetical protein [Agrobacterium sp. a22-2]NKN38768.1 hypothetical protein [Agrobacterium sp. a22-2]